MAAACVVGDCGNSGDGITAVGRCDRCKRAFCTSHQGRKDGLHLMWNRCVEHQGYKPPPTGPPRARPFEARRVKLALRQSNKPKVEVYRAEITVISRRFRGPREQVAYRLIAEGWIVGSFRWSWYGYGRSEDGVKHSAKFETVFIDGERRHNGVDRSTGLLMPVMKDHRSERWLETLGRGESIGELLDQAAALEVLDRF